MGSVQIIGRSSSHFTRVTTMFADELGVPIELVPVHDMTLLDAAAYADNPTLKLPTLRHDGAQVFGAENICRTLADLADLAGARLRLVWPEQLPDDVTRNAQTLVWHAMAAQVQLVVGTMIAKLPADNIYFTKCRAGFEGSLRWLDEHLAAAIDALPVRDLSLFEVTLFCLMDHLSFRTTVPIDAYAALARFTRSFAERPSARRTPYQFDRR